jgi:hypothetical protein
MSSPYSLDRIEQVITNALHRFERNILQNKYVTNREYISTLKESGFDTHDDQFGVFKD